MLIFIPIIYKDYLNNKKGPIPKALKILGFKGKSDKNSKKNLNNKILHCCKESIDNVLYSECLKYFITPRKLTIQKQLDKGGFKNYKIFCAKKLKDIYINSFPKNIKKSQKLEKARNGINEENKAIIKYVINQEKINKEAEIKKLDLLFNKTTFFIILNAFLEDQKYIIVDNILIDLIGFKTYNNYFKDMNPQKKEKLKKSFKYKLGMSNN